MITICMTNGGMYPNVNCINGDDASDISRNALMEILENDTFMTITINNGGQESVIRTSCISSINFI